MPDLKGIFHDLVRFEIVVWAAVDARLRSECDLQLTWFEIMNLLGEGPGQRIQDLAGKFAISVGGTSKVVDRIEAAGYCRRIPNPEDRRSAFLELTDKGKIRLAQALPVFEAELDLRFSAVLGGAELERLGLNLRLLRARAFMADGELAT